jgi:hypothetical protein
MVLPVAGQGWDFRKASRCNVLRTVCPDLLRLSVFVRGEAVATRDLVVRMRETDALAGADDRPEVDFVLFAAAMGVKSGAAASVRMAILQEFRVLGLRL